MADVALPTGALPKRAVQGAVIAGRRLGGTEPDSIVTTAGQSAAVIEVPVDALVTSIVVQSSLALTAFTIGIEGDDVTDDIDKFRTSAALTADTRTEATLDLPYLVETEGERIVIDSSAAITSASTGFVMVTYTQDPFVL